MLDAAIKALSQILSPPMRTILWRSIGLALVLIVVLAIGLQRLLSWFAVYGEGWAEAMLGPGFHTPLNVLAWIISIAAGFGVVFGAVFLMPAITSLVASVFVDDVADHVEREHYPAERPGTALPFGIAITEGVKTALLTILVYLIALPFVFIAGAGFLAFFIATAWLLGREYFELAAMRFRSPGGGQGDAQAKRRADLHRGAGDRGLRVDPDRQSGDAAVRHGLHGPHAQAIERAEARADRAVAQDRACRRVDFFNLAPHLRVRDERSSLLEGWGPPRRSHLAKPGEGLSLQADSRMGPPHPDCFAIRPLPASGAR